MRVRITDVAMSNEDAKKEFIGLEGDALNISPVLDGWFALDLYTDDAYFAFFQCKYEEVKSE